ncbi:unnamed protein product, partial [Musa textilis]
RVVVYLSCRHSCLQLLLPSSSSAAVLTGRKLTTKTWERRGQTTSIDGGGGVPSLARALGPPAGRPFFFLDPHQCHASAAELSTQAGLALTFASPSKQPFVTFSFCT